MADATAILTDFNMRSNRILNVADAVEPTSAPNLAQVEAAISAVVAGATPPQPGGGLHESSSELGVRYYNVGAGAGIIVYTDSVAVDTVWLAAQVGTGGGGTVTATLPVTATVTGTNTDIALDPTFLDGVNGAITNLHAPATAADESVVVSPEQAIWVQLDPDPTNGLSVRGAGLYAASGVAGGRPDAGRGLWMEVTAGLPDAYSVGAGPGIVVTDDTVSVDTAWLGQQVAGGGAGNGLWQEVPVDGQSLIHVGAGTGIIVNTDTVEVDQAWLAGQITAGSGGSGDTIATTPPLVVTDSGDTSTVAIDPDFLADLNEAIAKTHDPVASVDPSIAVDQYQGLRIQLDPDPTNSIEVRENGVYGAGGNGALSSSFVGTVALTGLGAPVTVAHNLGSQDLMVSLWKGLCMTSAGVCVVDDNHIQVEGDVDTLKVVVVAVT